MDIAVHIGRCGAYKLDIYSQNAGHTATKLDSYVGFNAAAHGI
jgi:hypothetical protein